MTDDRAQHREDDPEEDLAGRRHRHAASSSSRGTPAMKARNSRMQNGSPYAISIKIRPGMVLNSPTLCSTQMVGTTAGARSDRPAPALIDPADPARAALPLRRRPSRRRPPSAATLTTVRMTLLMKAMTMR